MTQVKALQREEVKDHLFIASFKSSFFNHMDEKHPRGNTYAVVPATIKHVHTSCHNHLILPEIYGLSL